MNNRLPPEIRLGEAKKAELSSSRRNLAARDGRSTARAWIFRKAAVHHQARHARSFGFQNRRSVAISMHVHGFAMRLLHDLDDGWEPHWRNAVIVPKGVTKHVALFADAPGNGLSAATSPTRRPNRGWRLVGSRSSDRRPVTEIATAGGQWCGRCAFPSDAAAACASILLSLAARRSSTSCWRSRRLDAGRPLGAGAPLFDLTLPSPPPAAAQGVAVFAARPETDLHSLVRCARLEPCRLGAGAAGVALGPALNVAELAARSPAAHRRAVDRRRIDATGPAVFGALWQGRASAERWRLVRYGSRASGAGGVRPVRPPDVKALLIVQLVTQGALASPRHAASGRAHVRASGRRRACRRSGAICSPDVGSES